ncbi:hypothetical protein BRADI_2g10903v3 [Brachypodium distachyon]|uniref:Uncharacterized protein n=1 Tax=Brachypodium distachyon TaxID=15368 RepID=A0A0Q3FX34_BRADI|nr:hypothetical protein BRADI_2g10903v3 [Brachypodium distachyon]
MSIPHSASLYLLYSVSTLPKRHRHGEPENGNGCFEFEFTGAEDDDDSSSSAAPRACSSDVGAAFADQLFRGGVLLPLKLPPRLHPSSAASSAATSPTAQQMGMGCRSSSSSWSPFASGGRKEMRGAGAGGGFDFDPFAAALEMVRRDGAGITPTPRRRARSLSPLRGAAGELLISSARPAAETAQKGPPWQRRKRGGVKHFLSTAPRALRPRCRKDDDGASSYRPGLLVCFGL